MENGNKIHNVFRLVNKKNLLFEGQINVSFRNYAW